MNFFIFIQLILLVSAVTVITRVSTACFSTQHRSSHPAACCLLLAVRSTASPLLPSSFQTIPKPHMSSPVSSSSPRNKSNSQSPENIKLESSDSIHIFRTDHDHCDVAVRSRQSMSKLKSALSSSEPNAKENIDIEHETDGSDDNIKLHHADSIIVHRTDHDICDVSLHAKSNQSQTSLSSQASSDNETKAESDSINLNATVKSDKSEEDAPAEDNIKIFHSDSILVHRTDHDRCDVALRARDSSASSLLDKSVSSQDEQMARSGDDGNIKLEHADSIIVRRTDHDLCDVSFHAKSSTSQSSLTSEESKSKPKPKPKDETPVESASEIEGSNKDSEETSTEENIKLFHSDSISVHRTDHDRCDVAIRARDSRSSSLPGENSSDSASSGSRSNILLSEVESISLHRSDNERCDASRIPSPGGSSGDKVDVESTKSDIIVLQRSDVQSISPSQRLNSSEGTRERRKSDGDAPEKQKTVKKKFWRKFV